MIEFGGGKERKTSLSKTHMMRSKARLPSIDEEGEQLPVTVRFDKNVDVLEAARDVASANGTAPHGVAKATPNVVGNGAEGGVTTRSRSKQLRTNLDLPEMALPDSHAHVNAWADTNLLQAPHPDANRDLSPAMKRKNQLYQDLQGHVSIVQEERRQQETMMEELRKTIDELKEAKIEQLRKREEKRRREEEKKEATRNAYLDASIERFNSPRRGSASCQRE